MRKLKLKKHKIATINNSFFIIGGAENSNAATFCDVTGDVSVTCLTNCDCDVTNENTVCYETEPGATRPNTGKTPTQDLCPNNVV